MGGVAENGAGEVLGVWESREREGEGEVDNRRTEGMKEKGFRYF